VSGDVAALVLAAGEGRRFGAATKQLALLDGRPLVDHVVTTARSAGLDPVVVVVGHDREAVEAALPHHVVVAHNPDWAEGQASSLRAGLALLTTTDARACVVLLADEPTLDARTVTAVVAAWQAGATVVRTAYEDRRGHPVLFDRAVWPRLAAATGDEGARTLLTDLPVGLVQVDGPAPRDVDHPDDLPRTP
jgi:CTP:molybdopterin cytidylyltransferase MocA